MISQSLSPAGWSALCQAGVGDPETVPLLNSETWVELVTVTNTVTLRREVGGHRSAYFAALSNQRRVALPSSSQGSREYAEPCGIPEIHS